MTIIHLVLSIKMAKTIDDLYNLIERSFEKLNTISKESSKQNTDFEDIVNNLNRLNHNLNDYNTTFEKEILTSQQDNLKEIERYNKELAELHKQHEDGLEKWREKEKTAYDKIQKTIDDANKILADKTKSVKEKADARKEIEKATKEKEKKDKEYDSIDKEGKSIDRKIKFREKKIKDKKDEITSAEEDRKTFKSSKIGKNTTKYSNYVKQMNANGKMMQSLGKSVGGTFGGAVGKAGTYLTKFAGVLGEAIPVIGWVITALQLLGDATKAVAEADAELQDIQNERNTARTNRNIERSKIDTQGLIDELEKTTAISLASFGVDAEAILAEQNIGNMAAIASMQAKTGSITNGFNAAAWDALYSQMDINAAKKKYHFSYDETLDENGVPIGFERAKVHRSNELLEKEYGARSSMRDIESKLVDQNLREKETELKKREYEYKKEHWIATTGAEMFGSTADAKNVKNPSGKKYEDIGSAYNPSMTGGKIKGVLNTLTLGLSGSFTDSYDIRQQSQAKAQLVNERNELNSTKAFIENTTSMSNATVKATNEMSDAFTNYTKSVIEANIDVQTTIEKGYAQFSQTIEQWTLNFEKIALDSAASKGITTGAQAQGYSRFMYETVQTASKWGLNEQDVIAMQNQYGQGTGRSILGTTTDIYKTAAMGKYLGDNGLAVELSNSTEIFNMGMSTTMELMWDMTKKVNKMGLDGRKYMKDMTQNLKIAQKYNFKGGVKGMMEMAKWAQNVRFDMNKLPALLEDILNGGLEGIIKKGAKLQVLGGNFAMGADPLAMMYEAMEDPAALAKRINSMTEGMGKFNSETGQVEFNGMEQRQLQLLAQYTGQDLTDVKNQASYGIKSAKMGNIFNSDLNEDQKASLVNKAYFEDGQWKVNDFKGNKMNVSEVTADNIGNLQAETHEGFVEQALQEIVGWQDKDNGQTTELQAKISQALVEEGEYRRNQKERNDKQLEELNKIEEWKNKVAGYWNAATTAFKAIKEDEDSSENKQAKALDDLNKAFSESNRYVKAIADKLKAEVSSAQSSVNEETNEMAASIVAGFAKNGKQQDLEKLIEISKNGYGSKVFDEKYGDIIGKGTSTQDAWFRELSDTQKDAIRNNPRLFYNVIKEMAKTGDNNVENQHLDDLKVKDGVVSSNGSSMFTAASNVTSINDGSVQLAQSDPQDIALFAKTGGPFDTLFNGIFAKINEISNVLPRSMEYIMPLERMFNEISRSKGTANNSKIQIEPIKLIIEGKLDLGNSNGQSVDIINEVRNNPILLRTLTQLISESMEKNINGGKSTYTGGVVTPRFN